MFLYFKTVVVILKFISSVVALKNYGRINKFFSLMMDSIIYGRFGGTESSRYTGGPRGTKGLSGTGVLVPRMY